MVLIELLSIEFVPLYVAEPGKIATVRQPGQPRRLRIPYGSAHRQHDEMGGDRLAPTDFQLKHDGNVLPPDSHLG